MCTLNKNCSKEKVKNYYNVWKAAICLLWRGWNEYKTELMKEKKRKQPHIE